MSWKGTPVPNSGTINKIYFNTNLSNDEVKALIDSLTFSWTDTDYSKGLIVASDDGDLLLVIMKQRTDTAVDFNYEIQLVDNSKSGDEQFTTYWSNNEGWITSEIVLDMSLVSEIEGIPVGEQNDKLSSLISITPFEEVQEEVTLDSWAEDIADAIREKKGIENIVEYSGTPVPNSGAVGTLYLNGKASVEDTKKILSSLTYEQDGTDIYRYWVFRKKDTTNYLGCYINKRIVNGVEEYSIECNPSSDKYITAFLTKGYSEIFPIEGWGTTTIDFNFDIGEGYGLENNKLSSIISITPFEETEVKILIPRLNFAQEIRSIEAGELLSPTAVPISGMIDKVYFNFNVDVSKMVEVIKNLSFIDAGLGAPVYPIISNIAGTDGLLFVKIDDNFYYLQRGGTHLIASISKADTEPEYEIKIMDNRDDSTFYKNDFTQPMEFGFENVVELATATTPDYVNSNELLKEMISITPVQKIESGSGGIIEVEELPTENIDENAIYKVKKKMTNAYIFASFTSLLVSDIANITGCEIVENKPTSNIVESNLATEPPSMYLYYVESENDIFVYANMGAGAMWFSTGLLMGQLNSFLAGLSFKGELEYLNINQTVESGTPNYSNVYGYYAVISSERKYKYNGTTWEIISPLNKSEDLLKLVADDLEELTFPKSLNVVPKYFSYHKNKLKKAIIEEGIIRIEEFAFCECKNLESVEIPSTVGHLEENIFNECIKLKNVKIPDGIYGIPISMFAGCNNLNSVVLPNSLEYISSRAFSSCGNLQILYKGTETEWNNISKTNAFEGTTYNVTYNYVD